MATKKNNKNPENLPVSWDEQLAAEAQTQNETESAAAGVGKFSIRGGELTFDGNPLPGNRLVCVITAAMFENTLYEGDFDEENPENPICFSLADKVEDLCPHANCVENGTSQGDVCKGCDHLQWGSSDKGRGKRCKEKRRLMLLPAGSYDEKTEEVEVFDDPKIFEKAMQAMLKIPVTSVKNYASYVTLITSTLKRPTHGVVTLITVKAGGKNQVSVLFEAVEKCADAVMSAVMPRREEALELISQPFTYDEEQPEEKPKKKKKAGTEIKKRAKKY